MVKQIVKSCLVAAMAISMAAPVMAADIAATVNGRTRTWLESTTVKDGPSYMQFKADGRLGAALTGKAGSWTATAFQNFDIDSDAGNTTATIREQKISLEDDSMAITLGRFSPYGVSKGMKYAAGSIYDAYWVGENMATTDITDHLTVGLKDLGLTAILGMNNYRADIDDPADGNVDPYTETVIGVVYGKEFGPVDLAVEYVAISSKIEEKDEAYAKASSDTKKDGAYDGASFSNLSLGAGYGISDTMGVALNYEATTTNSGVSGADAKNTSVIELWFDLGLNDTSGISVGYGMKTTDDGSKDKKAETMTNLTYAKTMGVATIFASYYATTAKDDDSNIDTNTSTMGAGLEMNF